MHAWVSCLNRWIPRLIEVEGSLELSSLKLCRAAPQGSCLGWHPCLWWSQDHDSQPQVVSVSRCKRLTCSPQRVGRREEGGNNWDGWGWCWEEKPPVPWTSPFCPWLLDCPFLQVVGRAWGFGWEGKTRWGAGTKERGGLRKKLFFFGFRYKLCVPFPLFVISF